LKELHFHVGTVIKEVLVRGLGVSRRVIHGPRLAVTSSPLPLLHMKTTSVSKMQCSKLNCSFPVDIQFKDIVQISVASRTLTSK
jgi:hypothetical protein